MTARGPIGGLTSSGLSPVATAVSERKRLVCVGVDYFAQAHKALSERSPFDADEVVATLPRVLAGLVLKQGHSRKKHKKLNAVSKVSCKGGSVEQDRSSGLWIEFEEWFRELTLLDIEKLYKMCVTFDGLASCSDFSIPFPGNAVALGKIELDIKVVRIGKGGVRETDDDPGRVIKEDVNRKRMEMRPNVEALAVKQQPMVGIDQSRDEERQGAESLHPNGKGVSGHELHKVCSVAWVLCSKNKILLTTTFPTKKRKLLGANAGLERLVVAHPLEGNSTLCHFCGFGDKSDQLNKLVICHTCNMTVHQKCYGIQGDADSSWLCSWCKWRKDAEVSRAAHTYGMNDGNRQPCILCPKSGGALKPLSRAGGEHSSSVEFAHLFCSQWLPEIHIEDMEMMEPIICVDEIKEIRWKLVCNVCRTRHGACIRCSYGVCRASFHPICAREAGHRLEIWGKFGCVDVELRAFCSKHSDLLIASDSMKHGESDDQSTPESKQLSLLVNRKSQSEVNSKNANRIQQRIQVSDAGSVKADDGGPREMGLQNVLFSAHHNLEHGVTRELVDVDTSLRSKAQGSSIQTSINLALILKKAIERGKFTLKQVASGTGISKETLAAAITVNRLVPDLGCKVGKWLQDHAYVSASPRKFIFELKSSLSSKADTGVCYAANVTTGKASDTLVVRRNSVLTRRRIFGDMHCLGDEQYTMAVKDEFKNNGVSTNVLKGKQYDESRETLISNGKIKIKVEPSGTGQSVAEPLKSFYPQCSVVDGCNLPRPYESSDLVKHKAPTVSSLHRVGNCDMQTLGPCPSNVSSASDSYVIPYIKKRIEELPSSVMKKMGLASGDASVYPCKKVNETGTLKSCSDDEVEGELIYLQHRLIFNAISRKHICDGLICKIVKNLSEEIDVVRNQRWDNVHLNQSIYELREAKKRGRKERRHEAEIVIPPAAATVASSSKLSSLRNVAGKLLQKAYCDMQSAEERAKIGNQKLGVEELKSISQMRVELERLRILCERIVKREKLKRELVVCSHDILASKRDSVAFSMLVSGPFLPLGGSSESATTSLNAHGAVCRSSNDAVRFPEDDQTTDGSSTSQRLLIPYQKHSIASSGNQLSRRASPAYGRSISESGGSEFKSRKPTETIEKELMMTSDQASMKNRRLPRGYIYVPLDCLTNQKLVDMESVGIKITTALLHGRSSSCTVTAAAVSLHSSQSPIQASYAVTSFLPSFASLGTTGNGDAAAVNVSLLLACLTRPTTSTPMTSMSTPPMALTREMSLSIYSTKGLSDVYSTDHHCGCSVSARMEENDYVRTPSLCSHSFHVDCIDIWLRSHAAFRIRPCLDEGMLEILFLTYPAAGAIGENLQRGSRSRGDRADGGTGEGAK
ncbi:PHD finger protein rhinoceros-like protein [Drosera capensis]